MLFNSLLFLVFLPVVLLVYWRLERRGQNSWLLLASYVFYASWDYRFLGLIALSTLVDFKVGALLHATADERRRKWLLTASLAVNLGILGFFKYCGFFVESAADLLRLLGLQPNLPLIEVILPVGISFYTFQTLSYTIDIYRRRIAPVSRLDDFALFVAYFPQLVAGPIERARNLLPRLEAPRTFSWRAIAVGTELILIGYAKKVGIADSLAPMIDLRFDNPGSASGAELLLVAYLFSIQIYCDFSGYSDIARGVSRLFGIELMRNFEQPYLSANVAEFWRRWHISLSTWLRDYLYIPLGGNRGGAGRTARNLMLTMLLGGLWHGANWTFVAWGALHGGWLVLHRGLRGDRQAGSLAGRLFGMFLTFHVVTFSWIFFRSRDFGAAWTFLRGLAGWQDSAGEFVELPWHALKIVVSVAVVAAIDLAQRRTGRHAPFLALAWPLRGVVYAGLILVTLAMGGLSAPTPFIYFQF